MIPGRIWMWSVGLAAARLVAFLWMHAGLSRDAQWQMAYWPLWIVDFPVSLIYLFLPAPTAEAVVGPIWWFLLPLLISVGRRKWTGRDASQSR